MRKVAAILGLFASSLPVKAYAENNFRHMQVLGRTTQPIGHYEYCKQYVSDCRIKSNSINAPILTKARWGDLVDVNSHANRTIRPVTDFEAYNREEVWAYPTSIGDCEDYVLMKRHMLMQRGWPASSLLITVVMQSNGEGHAVLTVRTDRADYVLDNLDGSIRPWHQTPYRYLKRQSERHSGHWIDIRDNRNQRAS